jgi:hypothetical protein
MNCMHIVRVAPTRITANTKNLWSRLGRKPQHQRQGATPSLGVASDHAEQPTRLRSNSVLEYTAVSVENRAAVCVRQAAVPLGVHDDFAAIRFR